MDEKNRLYRKTERKNRRKVKYTTLGVCLLIIEGSDGAAKPMHNNRRLGEEPPAIQLKEPEVFERLYDQWSDRIFGYLVHLVGDVPCAEDLFQETWMKVIEHASELRNPDRFGPWIFRIARNLAFNQMRARRRKMQIWTMSSLAGADGNGAESVLEWRSDPGPGPDAQAVGAQRREILRRVAGELPQDVQQMLHLRYFEQFKVAEIAEVMDVPLGTVCTKIHRGLKSIRAAMTENGMDDFASL